MSLARWMVVIVGAFSLLMSSCGGGTDTGSGATADDSPPGDSPPDDVPPGDTPAGSAAVAFDLSRTVGIVKVSGGASGKGIDPSQPFKKLTEAGAIEDFVTGSLSIQDVFVSPTGELFLMIRPSSSPSSTDAPRVDPLDGCALLRVGGEGTPECIDRTIDEVRGRSSYGFRSPSIQFDGSGVIYYTGRAGEKTVLRRRTPDGVVTDLISEHMNLGDFIVMPGGEVYLHGATRGTGSLWLRRLDAAGLHEIEGAESRTLWTAFFPDGNIYVGSMGSGLDTFDEYDGIYVIEAASGAVRERCWMGQYELVRNKCDPRNALHYAAPDFTQASLCAAAGRDRFCFELSMDDLLRTPDGAVFGVTHSSIRDIWKMYPAMEYFPVASIAKISVVAGLLDHLVVAGDDGAGRKRMVLKSIATGEEFDLLGETEVEVYHAIFGRDGKIWFDGRRFGDNVDVIGVVDPTTSSQQATFLSVPDVTIEDLIRF